MLVTKPSFITARFGIQTIKLFSTSTALNSGHSKWATIKHDKAKNDLEKNKISNKFANQIAVAAKIGGPEPVNNVRLASAIENALKANVVKKVIENAIKRGAGIGADKKNLDTALYEGIGPGNTAFVVESLTDNKARTVALVRSAFTKLGGSLSPTLFQFDRKGYIIIDPKDDEFDAVFEKVVESGAEDLEEIVDDDERTIEVVTEPTETSKVADDLKKFYKIKEVGITYIPKEDMVVEITNPDIKIKYDRLIKALDEIHDVTDYYTNLKE